MVCSFSITVMYTYILILHHICYTIFNKVLITIQFNYKLIIISLIAITITVGTLILKWLQLRKKTAIFIVHFENGLLFEAVLDNVHLQNSAELIRALGEQNIQFQLMVCEFLLCNMQRS